MTIDLKPSHTVSTEAQEARYVYAQADRLYSEAEVEAALDRMAKAIHDDLGEAEPLLLCTMIGGIVAAGKLLGRLDFPLHTDYVHATRY